ESSGRKLIELYGLKLACITRGQHGSILVSSERERSAAHAGFQIQVADTVGSGDAFTAGLLHEYFRGASLEAMKETANRVGALVGSEVGGTPVPATGQLKSTLAKIG